MRKLLRIEQNASRNIGLDLVRSVAVLLVVFGHGEFILKKSFSSFPSVLLIDGVDIFFVLSGFLIGQILIKQFISTEHFNVSALLYFWKRRWWRTLPAYYFTLILNIGYAFIGGTCLSVFSIKYLFFLQNIFKAPPCFFLESWSLTIEEWFYLSFPAILFSFQFLIKKKQTVFLISVLLFILFSFLYRLKRSFAFPELDDSAFITYFRLPTLLRFDAIGTGILLSYIKFFNYSIWNKFCKPGWFILAIILGVLNYKLAHVDAFHLKVSNMLVSSIAIFLTIPYLYTLKIANKTLSYAISHISQISYSMYLLNYSLILMPILRNFSFLNNPGICLLAYGLFLITVFITSTLMYKYIEKPAMSFRE